MRERQRERERGRERGRDEGGETRGEIEENQTGEGVGNQSERTLDSSQLQQQPWHPDTPPFLSFSFSLHPSSSPPCVCVCVCMCVLEGHTRLGLPMAGDTIN